MHVITVCRILTREDLLQVLGNCSLDEWLGFSTASHHRGKPNVGWLHTKMFPNLCRELFIGHLPTEGEDELFTFRVLIEGSKFNVYSVKKVIVVLSRVSIYDRWRDSGIVSMEIHPFEIEIHTPIRSKFAGSI